MSPTALDRSSSPRLTAKSQKKMGKVKSRIRQNVIIPMFQHQQVDYPTYMLATSNEPKDDETFKLYNVCSSLREEISKQQTKILSLHDSPPVPERSDKDLEQDRSQWTVADAPYMPECWSTSDLHQLRTLEYQQLQRLSLLAKVEKSFYDREQQKAERRMQSLHRRLLGRYPRCDFRLPDINLECRPSRAPTLESAAFTECAK